MLCLIYSAGYPSLNYAPSCYRDDHNCRWKSKTSNKVTIILLSVKAISFWQFDKTSPSANVMKSILWAKVWVQSNPEKMLLEELQFSFWRFWYCWKLRSLKIVHWFKFNRCDLNSSLVEVIKNRQRFNRCYLDSSQVNSAKPFIAERQMYCQPAKHWSFPGLALLHISREMVTEQQQNFF